MPIVLEQIRLLFWDLLVTCVIFGAHSYESDTSLVLWYYLIMPMDGPKPQIRESVFGTFFRFLGVLLLRGGANAERRFGFEPLDLMPSVWQRG